MLRYIDKWMLLLVAVLLTACRSSHEERQDEDCFLDIYVYAPGHPIVTRGDVGEIDQRDQAESIIHTLQIWVFKYADHSLVGYLGVDEADPSVLNEKGQQIYRMKVGKEFADYPEPVDVYVVANAASCGLSLDRNTTIAQLNEAVIGTSYFGTTDLYDYFGTTDLYDKDDLELPDGRIAKFGLPMSAMVENQPVTGLFPSLRIGTVDEMTSLELTRAVSKLRFVLCQINNQDSKQLVSINDIQLDEEIIPDKSWLLPRETNNYTFSHAAISYGGLAPTAIPSVENPLVYAYETQTAVEYETMINDAIKNGKLKEFGLTYLRESDKQLTGTINYTYRESGKTENTNDVAKFATAAPGDFLRNHSWIIYVYYMDSKIHVLTVTHIGMKKWTEDGADESITVYNW